MAGDKDTLIGMGFDPARVECPLSFDHKPGSLDLLHELQGL